MTVRTAGERATLAARIVVGAGVVMVACTWRNEKYPDLTVVGAVGIAVIIVAAAYLITTGITAWITARTGAGRGRAAIPSRAGSVAAAVLFVGLLLGLAAGVGFLVRWQMADQYAAHYGDRITATRSETCTVYGKDHGGLRASDRTECTDSAWQVGGQRRTGTVIVAWNSYEGSSLPTRIEAYAVGDRAYSLQPESERTQIARWGGVPSWLLWTGLALCAGAAFTLVRPGRLRRAAADA
jgi:hypothetical protein